MERFKYPIVFLMLAGIFIAGSIQADDTQQQLPYDSAYLHERILAHTQQLNTVDNFDEVSKSLKGFMALDEVRNHYSELTENDRDILDKTDFSTAEANYEYYKATTARSDKTFGIACELAESQKETNQKDAVAFARLIEQAESQHEEDALNYYQGIKNRLSPKAQKIFDEALSAPNPQKPVGDSRTDFVGLAMEIPEYIFMAIELRCEQRANARPKTLEDFKSPGRLVPITGNL